MLAGKRVPAVAPTYIRPPYTSPSPTAAITPASEVSRTCWAAPRYPLNTSAPITISAKTTDAIASIVW